MGWTVLVVEDEDTLAYFLAESLKEEGYEVLKASTGAEGLKHLETDEVDLVLLDLRLPDMDGLDILRELKGIDEGIQVIILTGHGAVMSAVEAMRLGAYDYVEKPLNLDALKLNIVKALESRALRQEIRRLRSEHAKERTWVVGRSQEMKNIVRLVERISPSKASVLIQGESGTGKEVIAQAIHRQSERSLRPFVAINCAAIPETLLESELFGYEAGAFTDAKRRKQGLVETADGGTLFLDEISGMRQNMQAKLLRVIEMETFRRVGGTKDTKVDLRIIAATNRDLRQAISEGEFREDLFYRLSVVVINIPPLRDRIEDIDLFVAAFIAEFARAMGKNMKGISHEALRLLRSYHWPGNVRELKNVMERAAILCDGEEVRPEHLPAEIVEGRKGKALALSLGMELGEGGMDLRETVAQFEKRMIEEALERTKGNQSEAARLLGISRDMLRYSLQKYGLS